MATIDDIVRLSRVSRSTVFRFLNGNNVRAEAKKAIINAMKDLNYKPDELYKYQKIEIEISLSEDFESFQGFTQVVEGITKRATEKNIKINLVRRTGDKIISDYSSWHDSSILKGVIVVGKDTNDTLLEAKMLKQHNIPHIFVNRIFSDSDISYISADLNKAAYDIVNYLINKGKKRIAVIGCPNDSQVDIDKLQGYKNALKDNNISLDDNLYYELSNMLDWENTVNKLLNMNNRPDAFFAICDSHAMRFIKIANANNLKIPDDISLVGMDDIEMCKYTHPSLTTVHIPFNKMGSDAVDQLLHLITDEECISKKTIVKHSIKTRESC